MYIEYLLYALSSLHLISQPHEGGILCTRKQMYKELSSFSKVIQQRNRIREGETELNSCKLSTPLWDVGSLTFIFIIKL